jgi:hypothetical protein
MAGTLAGGALPKDSGAWAVVALGVALMLYALAGLFSLQLRVPARHEAWLGPVMGAATGLVTAATGVFVIPAVPYLQGLGLARDALVQALGLAFRFDGGAGGQPVPARRLQPRCGGRFGLCAAAGDRGHAGRPWLRGRISQQVFKRCFVGLFALGLHSAVKPWLG